MKCLGYGGDISAEQEGDDEDFSEDHMADETMDDEDTFTTEAGVEDRHTIWSIDSIMDDFDISAEAFGEGVLQNLKLKEMELIKRRECGYYRSKHKHAVVYGKIAEAISPYLTRERLMELHHNFHTQKNESMNQSVSSYAPKTKTYSKTKSLEARVCLAAAIEIAGYHEVWKRIFEVFALDLDDNLASVLKTMDEQKKRQSELAISKQGKLRRNKNRTAKMNILHKQDMADQSAGITYEAGIGLKKAREKIKLKEQIRRRQQRDIVPALQTCRYHHVKYCRKVGHSKSNHKDCYMYRKSKVFRDAVEKEILAELLDQEIKEGDTNGT